MEAVHAVVEEVATREVEKAAATLVVATATVAATAAVAKVAATAAVATVAVRAACLRDHRQSSRQKLATATVLYSSTVYSSRNSEPAAVSDLVFMK